jgi:hypothetical protein
MLKVFGLNGNGVCKFGQTDGHRPSGGGIDRLTDIAPLEGACHVLCLHYDYDVHSYTYRKRAAVWVDVVAQKSQIQWIEIVSRNCCYDGSNWRRLSVNN